MVCNGVENLKFSPRVNCCAKALTFLIMGQVHLD